MAVRVILALVGVFAMVSGWLKSRERVRTTLGGVGLGQVEALIGVVLFLAQVSVKGGESGRMALGWVTLGAVAASNMHAILRARRVTREREASQGHRLYTQIKFQQAVEGGKPGVETPPAEKTDF